MRGEAGRNRIGEQPLPPRPATLQMSAIFKFVIRTGLERKLAESNGIRAVTGRAISAGYQRVRGVVMRMIYQGCGDTSGQITITSLSLSTTVAPDGICKKDERLSSTRRIVDHNTLLINNQGFPNAVTVRCGGVKPVLQICLWTRSDRLDNYRDSGNITITSPCRSLAQSQAGDCPRPSGDLALASTRLLPRCNICYGEYNPVAIFEEWNGGRRRWIEITNKTRLGSNDLFQAKRVWGV
ncbi:hypothetical protein J6590_047895 [Homalodisca vitripennis]|nr:hypothetical protein J6590_047895 [Homalodisca vitripennis]